MGPSLRSLIAGATASSVLSLMKTLGGLIGLKPTSWPQQGQAAVVWELCTTLVASYAFNVSRIVQGGSPTLAARMLFGDGSEDPSWQDAICQQQYNVTRQPPSFAAGNVQIVNSGASKSYGAGQFHLLNAATGATYSNRNAITIKAGSGGYLFQADQSGSAGTAATGTVLQMVTPVIGLTIDALPIGLVGLDAQDNQAYLTRCYASLGTLSPAGHPRAYFFYATGATVPSGIPINRCTVRLNPFSGVVEVYVSDADGGAPPGDVTAVLAAIAPAIPDPFSATVIAATQGAVDVTGSICLPSSYSSTVVSADLIAAATDSLTEYIAACPIGGILGVLPRSGIETSLFDGAYNYLVGLGLDPSALVVEISVPANDLPVALFEVPVLFGPTISVVYL
jgi:hypothetical protein